MRMDLKGMIHCEGLWATLEICMNMESILIKLGVKPGGCVRKEES